MSDSALAEEIMHLNPSAKVKTNGGVLISNKKLINMLETLRLSSVEAQTLGGGIASFPASFPTQDPRTGSSTESKSRSISPPRSARKTIRRIVLPSGSPGLAIPSTSVGFSPVSNVPPLNGPPTPSPNSSVEFLARTGAPRPSSPRLQPTAVVEETKDDLMVKMFAELQRAREESNAREEKSAEAQRAINNSLLLLVSRVKQLEEEPSKKNPKSSVKTKGTVYPSSGDRNYYQSPTKVGGGEAHDDAKNDDDEEDGDDEDDCASVHSQDSNDHSGNRTRNLLLSSGKDCRARVEKQMQASLGPGSLMSVSDILRFIQRENGLVFVSASGSLIRYTIKYFGTPKKAPISQFTEVSGAQDPSATQGDTFLPITVNPLPRTLSELVMFIDEQLEILISEEGGPHDMSPEDILAAVRSIQKFKRNCVEFFETLLGPEGPTVGGGSRQWTDWLAFGLLFYSVWNKAAWAREFSLLESEWPGLKSEAIALTSKSKGPNDTPTLKLEHAMTLAGQQCSSWACSSNKCASAERCFQCEQSSNGNSDKHTSRYLSKAEWEAKPAQADANPKLSKEELSKKYGTYRADFNSKTPRKAMSYPQYVDYMSLNQGLIGSPAYNLVGKVPHQIHSKKSAST